MGTLRRPFPSGFPGRGPQYAYWDHNHFQSTGPGSITEIVENIIINNGGTGISFPTFDFTTVNVPMGTSLSVSAPWSSLMATKPLFIEWIVAHPSNPDSIYDFKILRTADLADLNAIDALAFYAVECNKDLIRGFIWEYNDDDSSGQIHFWVHNYGPGDTTLQFQLNERVPV